jgi:hypothetical protein
MKTEEALKIVGGLSRPSKMPGWSYGLPAKECKTGGKLQKIPGSVCYNCYALKGCYVFKVVQDAQYRRLKSIRSPLWVGAMAMLINSKKANVFRWHDSGDIQDEEHLLKIFAVAKLTPTVKHWMPTREAWVKAFLPECPKNLIIRFSVPMVDQSKNKAPKGWRNTSTVSSDLNKTFTSEGHFCPAPKQNNECGDCRACWDGRILNVVYGEH